MLGKRVVVTSGPRRGYDGYIRAVGNTSVTVELGALYASSVSPFQSYTWDCIRPMYVHTSIDRVVVLLILLLGRRRRRPPEPDLILAHILHRLLPRLTYPAPRRPNPKEVS